MLYLIGDLELFNEEVAKKQKMTIKEYTEIVAANYKDIVQPDDYVFFMGKITNGNKKQTGDFFSTIPNGHKTICDYQNNRELKRNDWKDIGFENVDSFPCHFMGNFNGMKEPMFVLTNKKQLIEYATSNKFSLVTDRIMKSEQPLTQNILNVSIGRWSLAPIEIVDTIPSLYKNLKEFNSMNKKGVE